MASLSIMTVNGQSVEIIPEALLALKGGLRGQTLTRDEDGYDSARSIWNGMVDRSPGLIVRCHGAADVMHAVDFARERDLVVAVRGGGHNIAGNAVCEGGLMVDLSPMNFARVDPAAKRAWVGPGARSGSWIARRRPSGWSSRPESTRRPGSRD